MAGRGKSATILLIDVGHSMSQACDADKKLTKASKAVSLALAWYKQKLFFTPKHEVGIVLFGAATTHNELAADGYDNVFAARDNIIDVPDLEALKFLMGVQPGRMPADAVNGLILAVHMLHKRCANAKYAKSIHMFTDGASIAPDDPDFEEVKKQLTTGINLSITLFGDSVEPWRTLAADNELIEIVPVEKAERAWSVCSKPVEQRAKVRLSLEFAPEVHIPVGIYGKTLSCRMPGLKKRSKTAAAVPLEHQKTDKVIVERTYHVADDEAGEEVKADARIKGYKYGGNIVPMSEHDEAALMYTCERTLKTLGFAPASCLGPEHNTGQIEAVAADKGDRFAFLTFESLISAMVVEHRVLIARYCYRKNSAPRVVALVPHLGADGSSSYMDLQYLPFADDMREWTFASLPVASVEQRAVVASLVDAMDLDIPGAASAGIGPLQSPIEVLQPENTNSPSLDRFYSFLAQRAVEPNAKVPLPSPEHLKVLERPDRTLCKLEAGKCAENLKRVFALERVEKTSKKQRRFWREAIAEKRKEASFGEVDTKQIKVDAFKKDEKEEDKGVKIQGGQFQMGGGAASSDMAMAVPAVPMLAPKVHIGSVHPERDFEKWLAHREGGHDCVGPAIEQMKNIIESLAEEGDDFHAKALSCLNALRSGCVREGEVILFNNFVRVLRAGKTPRKAKFWLQAREAGLGLITDVEAPTSTVTAEDSRAFLAGEETLPPPVVAAPIVAAPLSEQALEDMIE